MTILGESHSALQTFLGVLAVILATMNIVGGFVVTDRMLEMFKGRGQAASAPAERDSGPGAPAPETTQVDATKEIPTP